MRSISIAVLSLFVVVFSAEAQEWRQIPSSRTNSQGYKISGYTVRATASGCQGSQNYAKIGNPNDKGVSIRRWTSVSKQDGGMLCSGGTWYYDGTKAGQTGGSEPDVLIKNGKFYRRG